ncbi:MAG: DUF2281 domain-containing protein [Pyrinomonadaceae bacterium]
MTSEEIIKEIASLPAEARREIEDFVAFLRARYASRKPPAKKFESEEFFGIWRDRDEMTDSTAWVRSVREKHWAN